MKVNEILSNGKITLSFEVFPPKTDAQFESVRQATIDVAALKPSYMSVTYGAGGNTRKNTVAIAKGKMCIRDRVQRLFEYEVRLGECHQKECGQQDQEVQRQHGCRLP